MVLRVRTIVLVLGKTGSLNLFDLFDCCNVDSVRIVNPAGGIAHGQDFHAHLGCFLGCVDSYVSCTGDAGCLSGDVNAVQFQQLSGEVEKTVAGSLCSCEGSAVGQAFSGENAFVQVADSLILTEEITDLTSAYADITGRNVGICSDVFAKLGHEALAESHNLTIRFTLRVEVGAAFAAADGKTGQGVFKYLLKAQKFDNA